MRLLPPSSQPIYSFTAASVVPGGRGFEFIDFPVLSAVVDELPEGLDALVLCGDLQAISSVDVPLENRTLVGISIAEQLALLGELGLLPDPGMTGVLLTGDLFTDPALSKRGGTGDVLPVWAAFASRFRWVVGVAGNHDLFHGRSDCELPGALPNAYLLDGSSLEIDGLRVAGISGIVGPSRKPWRRDSSAYVEAVASLLRQPPDVFLSHEAPLPPDGSERGLPEYGQLLSKHSSDLIAAFGHVAWSAHWIPTESVDLLNLEARVVYLTRAELEPL